MFIQKDVAHDTGVSFTYAITDYFEGLMKSRKKENIGILGVSMARQMCN